MFGESGNANMDQFGDFDNMQDNKPVAQPEAMQYNMDDPFGDEMGMNN